MISVNEAKELVHAHTERLPSATVAISDAVGCILSEDIHANFEYPFFDQSAMDGYAYNYESCQNKKVIEVTDEIAAGDTRELTLENGKCVRIYTGALLPEGADSVIIQEKVVPDAKLIQVNAGDLKKGDNVRQKGCQTKKSERLLLSGTKLTPAAIGLLVTFGIHEVNVFTTPRVGIITTGNELVYPGEPLRKGQVYNSGTFMLLSALLEGRMEPAFILHSGDDTEAIKNTIASVIDNCDLLLISGGMSVGKYDHGRSALLACGVQEIFYKVNQRPGKVLFFGKKDQTLVFGLPGNPAASLTCFYEYVTLSIRKMYGMPPIQKQKIDAVLSDTIIKPGVTYFLKGKVDGSHVTILSDQESFKLNSFAEGNCLVEITENNHPEKKINVVHVNHLDRCWM